VSVEIHTFELLARGGAISAFAALGFTVARPPFTPAKVTGALFCIGAIAHTLTQYAAARALLGIAWPVVWAFSVMGAGLLWAFATEVFEDRRQSLAVRLVPTAALLAIGIAASQTTGRSADALWLAHKLVGSGLMVHIVVSVWAGWSNDLVESRRSLRGPVLAAGAIYAFTVLALEALEIFWRRVDELSPVSAAALFALGLGGIAAFLRADPNLFATPDKPRPAPIPKSVAAASDDDTRAADELDRLMRIERLYREETLSIATLALRLEIPEYRLRRLINQQLRYRNFNAFLNRWRLADAIGALSDPAQREVSISTIALDAGYGSLGPFNRAFKAETGITPTEYRSRALAGQELPASSTLPATD
jgi:AraC-like DNA-binding protein